MGTRCFTIAMIFLIIWIPFAIAGNLDQRVAVLPFEGRLTDVNHAVTLSELVRFEIGEIDQYEVIDRGSMELILKEQQVQLHDCTEASCAVRAGMVLNVRWIIIGSLSKIGSRYLLIARRVDVQTAEIVDRSRRDAVDIESLIDTIPGIARELLGMEAAPVDETQQGTLNAPHRSAATGTEKPPTLPPVVNQSGQSGYSVPPPVIRGGGEPPTIEWISQPPGTMSIRDGRQVEFKFRGYDDRCIEVYHYRFDDQPMAESRRGQVVLKNVGEGNHTFQVMVEDCDGNVSSPLRCDFAVRNMPPEVTIWSPKKGETIRAKKLLVRLAGEDSDGSVVLYRCAVNNPSNPREQSSPDFTFDVADGPVVIYAQAVDDAGLESAWAEQRSMFQYLTEPTPTPTPKPGDWDNPRHLAEKTVDLGGGVTLEMVYLKNGSFKMGSPPGESGRYDNEGPVHDVTLDGFWMGKYEVTQSQYERIMGTNPSNFKGSNRPVETVSWNDAMDFCRKLSSRTGQTFTLPTEAQWEYACRAGSSTRFCFGDSDSGLGAYAWYNENAGGETHNVGGKRANAWGLHDMHGNVLEWCLDWYGDDYHGKSPVRNPAGPGSGSRRVFRGGCWNFNAGSCRSADRCRSSPSIASFNLGFRVVRTGS